ncbi:NAD(P)/FAD-dependent oxidoreductase [Thiomicrorhabdus heinhorstiae]|uniref:FAD-dependent oxidoreductase n=1 Tax=Thiomicrorhabdus heinhorstiae TaxID=2748010 RepID=A0ABS0BXQ4_9GAMM|nr:FAD-dependent oxidoreductase [Thiomicrorhabdus heinhorstiae]MBF6057878.1 FAD-dependent oxidoreductase [Thiomicrorhabdus heinhorstiae]
MSDAGVVIIGAGQAGATVASGLAQAGYQGSITLIGEESYAPYQRPPLSKGFINGDTGIEGLLVKPESYYAQKHIQLIKGCRVQSIQPGSYSVQLDNGEQLSYGSLVLCTGSRPRALSIKGADLKYVFSLRNIDDAQAIKDALPEKGRLVIVGAGYVGLELAASCVKQGLTVTVLERAARVMERSASPQVSEHYRAMHEAAGVNIVCDVNVLALQGEQQVTAVEVEDGRVWPADVVVIGVGAVANTELAQSVGLQCDDGILIDDQCRSSIESIYAAGDCTRQTHALLQKSLRLESVQNATAQARMIVAHMMNKPAPRSEVPWFWSDQFDVRLQIAGIVQPDYTPILRGDPDSGSFSVLHMLDDRLQALEGINRPMDFTLGRKLISEQIQVNTDSLMDESIPLYPPPVMTKSG